VRIDHIYIGVDVPADAVTGAAATAWRSWIIPEHVGRWLAVHEARKVQRKGALADLVRAGDQVRVRNPANFMGALNVQARRAVADGLPSAGI